MSPDEAVNWVRTAMASYRFDLIAILRRGSDGPISVSDADALEAELARRGMLLPLPKEPAALANILEITLVDHLAQQAGVSGLTVHRGTERGYPDLEIEGPPHFAVDIKVARRNKSGSATQSRITLFTGNTYFRYPQLHWPGTFRPFRDYSAHIDALAIYTLDKSVPARVTEVELIAHESWRIGSRQRSSTTREYIGAVQRLDQLRDGEGEFDSRAEFEDFWRAFPFKIGRAAQKQLDRLLRESDEA